MVPIFSISKRAILIASTSLIVACAVAWAGLQEQPGPVLQQSDRLLLAQSGETVSILVAGDSIREGDPLSAKVIDTREMLLKYLDETFLPDTESNRLALNAVIAQRAVPKGTPLVESDLITTPMSETVELPPQIKNTMKIGEGMRAISVPVSAETAVSGLLSYGDRVDVLVSYQHQEGVGAIRTVLRNVRVIATDQQVGEVGEIPKQQPKTITLELHPEGAKTLALAQRTGDLVLVLSPPSDSAMPIIVDDAPMLSTQISGVPIEVAPVPAAVKVQVFRGNGARANASAGIVQIDRQPNDDADINDMRDVSN